MKRIMNIFDRIERSIPNAEIAITKEKSSLILTIRKCIDHDPHGPRLDQRPWGLHRKFTASDIAATKETDWEKKVDEFCKFFKTEFARQKKFIKENE